MREARIRREPSKWYKVEKVTLWDDSDISIKSSYHKNLFQALREAKKWIQNKS